MMRNLFNLLWASAFITAVSASGQQVFPGLYAIDPSANPYNVPADGSDGCEGLTHAFSDAARSGTSIRFGPGTFYSSCTLTWKGQSVLGSGEGVTYLRSAPGKDFMAAIDGLSLPISNFQEIGNFTAQIDSSRDVSGTGTFVSRVTGTDLGHPAIASVIPPPWKVGNCFLAVPDSDATKYTGTLTNGRIHNIDFEEYNSTTAFSNHTCALFFQTPPYNSTFQNNRVSNIFYGFIQAPPGGSTEIAAFSGDYNEFEGNSYNTVIPFVWYNGARGVMKREAYYGANRTSLGPMLLKYASAGNSTDIYGWIIESGGWECNSAQTGELSRFVGGYHTVIGYAFAGCSPKGYVSWYANSSTGNVAGLPGGTDTNHPFHMLGSGNSFLHTIADKNAVDPQTLGQRNTVTYVSRAGTNDTSAIANLVAGSRPDQNLFDGSFLTLSPLSPFANLSDLVSTCGEWVWISGVAINPLQCISDPTVLPSGGYGRWLTNQGDGSYSLQTWNGKQMIVGDRIPQTTTTFYYMARAATASNLSVRITVPGNVIQTCHFRLLRSFHLFSCTVDLSVIPTGSVLKVSGSPDQTINKYVDTAFFAFEPAGSTPASSSAVCAPNTTWADDNYLYHCLASGHGIKRIALTLF